MVPVQKNKRKGIAQNSKNNINDSKNNNHTSGKILLGLSIKKLQHEIENAKTLNELLKMRKENFELKIKNLKMKYEKLSNEISTTERVPVNDVISPKSNVDNNKKIIEDVKKHPQKSNKKNNCSENKQDMSDDPIQKLVYSRSSTCNALPYIVLMPRNDGVKRVQKKFFLERIFDTYINEYFELVSEDPFEILPLNKDIPLKLEHLNMLKPTVLQSVQNSDKIKNNVPRISIINENDLDEFRQHDEYVTIIPEAKRKIIDKPVTENIIDLTDEQKCLKRKHIDEQIDNISKKLKNDNPKINKTDNPKMNKNNTLNSIIEINEDIIEIQ